MFGRSTLSHIFVISKFDHGLSQSRTCRSRGRGGGLRIDQASRLGANCTNLNINMLEMVARRRIRVNHHACVLMSLQPALAVMTSPYETNRHERQPASQ